MDRSTVRDLVLRHACASGPCGLASFYAYVAEQYAGAEEPVTVAHVTAVIRQLEADGLLEQYDESPSWDATKAGCDANP